MEIRRPLKRNLPKLGPPDIYPQDPKQREDELTTVNVKHGYSSAPLISGPNTLDEFGTAKNANIDAFGVYFSALLSEKHRINTIKDTQKKKQLVNTKEIWYVHAKTKNSVDIWFRDLASGAKSLSQLAKFRIPVFNSKEGIFSQLHESHVPFTKAVWFIKMSTVHAIALSESSAKTKKRQVPDQCQELTSSLTRYLKDILSKLFECYQQAQHNAQAQSNQSSQPLQASQPQPLATSKDPQTLLTKLNTPKSISPKPPLHNLNTHASDTNQALSTQNNLPYSSISSLLNDQSKFAANLHTTVANLMTAHTASVASIIASSTASLQAVSEDFASALNQWQYQTQLARYLFDEGLLDRYDFLCFLLELIEKKRPINDLFVKIVCPIVLEYVTDFSKSVVLSRRSAHVCAKRLSQAIHHNNTAPSTLYSNLIYILSSMIQVICIECPTALVRHHIIDSKFPSMYQGSPLDNLPCLPSNLPMLESDLNSELRRTIYEAEREILYRSAMSDSKWSCTSSRKAEYSKSVLVNRLLMVLTTLDKYNFDKIDSANSYETLYSKIFPATTAASDLLMANRVSGHDMLPGAMRNSSATSDTGSPITTNMNQSLNHSASFEHSKKSRHQQAQSSSHINPTNDQFDVNDESTSHSVGAYERHVVKLLCEWATTTQRTGEHRALVVARLLERRQAELQARNKDVKLNLTASFNKKAEDLKSTTNENCPSSGALEEKQTEMSQSDIAKDESQDDTIEYMFQDLLVQFLDENAPVLDVNHNDNLDAEKAFNNLVLLYSELIRCDVFSHYNYMCTLISRGMFNELSVNEKTQQLVDNHIDDIDADLGKILQDIKEGQQDEEILLPDFLGGSRDDSGNKNTQINKLSPFGLSDRSSTLDNTTSGTPNVMSSNNFPSNHVESKSIGMSDEKNANAKNANEQRHLTFVRHFPVPEDESFARDINQRNVLLHGFGKEREEARHAIKRLNKEICKLLSRRSCIDINDGGRVKKIANRDCFNPEATLHKFEALDSHDQHLITNSLSIAVLELFTGVSSGQTFALPTLESMSFILDLYCMSSNVSGLLELIILILEELPDVEVQIKLKCPAWSCQYVNSIALCIIGMLYRYHSCVLLLSKEEVTSIFESLCKIVSHIPNPGLCMTSAERVIFSYLYDIYISYHSGKPFSSYSWLMSRMKSLFQCANSTTSDGPHEWVPTFLTTIVQRLGTSNLCSHSVTNPILNASVLTPNIHSPESQDLATAVRQQLYSFDSHALRQINENSNARYNFVCDAVYLCATSNYTDLVNDIAVLCADMTSKCPALTNEWLSALQALLCSSLRDHTYRHISNKINITDPQVMDNIAIFTAILVARRCILLNDFIIRCAMQSICAPLGQVDQHSTESGVRLTCHILLALFRNRESPSSQSRCNQPPLYNSHSAFGQAFPNYGSNFNGIGGMSGLGSVSQMGLLQPLNKDSDGGSKTLLNLKYLCDHHLLRAACCNTQTECHITLLKAIRVLVISSSPNADLETQGKIKSENHMDDLSTDGSNLIMKDGLDRINSGSPTMMNSDQGFGSRQLNLQTASLHQFADTVLRLLCSQRWLHDKCLTDSEIFTTTDTERNILLDPRMDIKQSQRLLYMICYNKSPELQADVGLDDQGSDQVASIVKMFESLDVWSMRLSLMRLQFMFAYCKSQSNVMLNDWLDNLAKAVVEFFQKASQDCEVTINKENENSPNDKSKKSRQNPGMTSSVTNINKVWLVEPLLNKLAKPPSAVQNKVIKASASLMESASVRANSLPSLNQTYLSTAAASTKFKERTLSQRGSASTNPSNLASTSLLGFQPFLSLLLSCLRNQDKERETLLTSLNSQLYQAIHEKVDDIGYKQSIQDGLELRLCLIGQMFDSIQRSPNLTSDWATLLLLLIMNNLVDPQLDYGLYVTVLDMLAMLIQTAYASDPIEQREDAKKQYQNLMKKFRKELGALEEKGFIQMQLINPLMPLPRMNTEVITCEPMGSLVDTKGEKVENFYSIDKKKGLKVAELQEVSPWELIEGHKNPAPLCWPWFGAIKLEHKPLRADENNRLMSWHTHTIRNNISHYATQPNIDDGPPSAKRSNVDKKPSQSNPLLKSLIEANDEVTPIKKEIVASVKSSDEDILVVGEHDFAERHLNKSEEFLEDYCELPMDLLFDPTPIENMIEDIKTAMQAEETSISNRNKPIVSVAAGQVHQYPHQQPNNKTKAQSQAKSSTPMQVLPPQHSPAPTTPISIQSPRMIDVKGEIINSPASQASSILAPVQPSLIEAARSTTPQVSALSALQNLNAPPVVAQPEPKPKARRNKRVSKKDTLAQQQLLQQQQLQQQQQQQQQHQQQQQQQVQQQPQPPQPQQQTHHPHQHTNHPIQYQPQQQHQHPQLQQQLNPHQIVPQQQIRLTGHQQPMSFQAIQPQRQPQQQQVQQQQQTPQQSQHHPHQHQHHTIQYQPQQQHQHPQLQHQLGAHQTAPAQHIRLTGHQQPMSFQSIPQQRLPQQHMQQQQQSQPPPQQQQQQQQHHSHQHPHHQIHYQAPQQQQHAQRHHQLGSHQIVQTQNIRLTGHQQPMSFQAIPQQRQPQQQIFSPQQPSRSSRPALTAMLHNKANSNLNRHQNPPRYNFEH